MRLLTYSVRRIVGAGGALAFAALATTASAQVEDRAAPLGVAPGSPSASYALSDLERIDLFNGSVTFYLPLLTIDGRGEAGYTAGLTIERRWGVAPGSATDPRLQPRFDWWRGFKPGFGPGILRSYRDKHKPAGSVMQYLTRLTFTAPDGTQQDLRDVARQGQPTVNATEPRGRIFQTSDGSAMTFVSDADITGPGEVHGMLLFRDGRQYRIDAGLVTWIRDRNGNLTSFQYGGLDVERQVTRVTDAAGRIYDFSYVNPGGPSLVETIHFKGFGGSAREIRLEHGLLSSALVDGEATGTLDELFPNLSWMTPGAVHDPIVRTRVVLPDLREYTFRYNRYGELAEVILPTGARIQYTYQAGLSGDTGNGTVNDAIYRRIASKSVLQSDGTPALKVRFGQEVAEGANQSVEEQRLDVLAGDGVASTTRHYFHGKASNELATPPLYYPPWNTGREYQTDVFGPSGATLRKVYHTWAQRQPVPTWNPSMANDPRINQTTITLEDIVASTQVFTYDQYNNRTSTTEHAFGLGANGPVRRTTTDYVTAYASELSTHIRDLPLVERVYEGGGSTPVAQTTYEYDNYAADGQHAVLAERSGIVGLDAAYKTPGFINARGNATAVVRTLNVPGGSVATYRQYDVAGNVVKAIDGRGNATTFGFSDNFGSPDAEADTNVAPPELSNQSSYAFPTTTTNAKAHVTRTQYDFHLGKPVNVKDANGIVGSIAYNDALGRPTQVVQSHGDGATKTSSSFSYADGGPNPRVDVYVDKDVYGDGALRTAVVYDSLGREVSKLTSEGSSWITSDEKAYDGLGRVAELRNPFRVDGEATGGVTKTRYDGLDRPTEVEMPGGFKIATAYAGDVTTIQEAAGTNQPRSRRTTADALGRVISVVEDHGGLGYETTYAYNVLDQVTRVLQGTQERTFAYDSLGRLICASNPESRVGATSCLGTLPSSGVDRYSYDGNGNLVGKTDARGITTSYTYDALDRIQGKSYNDGKTPAVGFGYDEAINGKGRLNAFWATIDNQTWGGANDEYDRLGRVRKSRHVAAEKHYYFEYTYDLAGNLLTEKYPSGRIITLQYDPAGRLRQLNEGTYLYARVAQAPLPPAGDGVDGYTPHGAVARRFLGNRLWQRMDYNCRLQQWQAGLGTMITSAEAMQLQMNYGTDRYCTANDASRKNNGNLLAQNIIVATPFASPTSILSQTYTYDGVDRILSVAETTNVANGQPWSQAFSYDRWGNRTVTAGAYDWALTPTAFSPATNRITGGQWQYDAAGNQTVDGRGRTFEYDAENRLVKAGTVQYLYNAEGRRVRKVEGTTTTLFIYDAFGRLIAEYGAAMSLGTRFLTTDHLGSTRLVTDHSANVISRMDYLPFGETVRVSTLPGQNWGGRANIQGYGFEGAVRHKFTGHERDAETGLDFFQARYYSGPQGRFTTADQPFADQRTGEPQSWNLYAYVRNRPFAFIDPSGRNALWVKRRDGRATLVIPVKFVGQGATKDKIEAIVSRANGVKVLDPRVSVEVVATDSAMGGVLNTLNFSPGYDTEMCGTPGECTNELGGNNAHINSNNSDAIDGAAHEVFHFAGINDAYEELQPDEKGRRQSRPRAGFTERNLMASRKGKELTRKQMQQARRNESTRACKQGTEESQCK